MTTLKREDRVIRAIIKEYGAQIDLARNPELFIELVRKYAFDLAHLADSPDGGTPPLPGGVPPSPRPSPPEPAPPPGPSSRQIGPHFEDVMRELLKIQRKISAMEKRLG